MMFSGKLKINNHVQSKSTNCTQILSAFADLNVNKGNCHINHYHHCDKSGRSKAEHQQQTDNTIRLWSLPSMMINDYFTALIFPPG